MKRIGEYDEPRPDYGRGAFTGYSDYRYGSKKPVTLAGSKKAAPAILPAEKRQHIINDVIDVLRDWRNSPFESEGALIAGLRSTWCLDGNGWFLSDLQAREVVFEAQRITGVQRPTWEQAQRTYTDSPDFCSWCQGPLDDENRDRRFCTPHCARAALEHRDYERTYKEDALGRAARHFIMRSGNPLRNCLHCNREFRGLKPEANFCSSLCVNRYYGPKVLLTEIPCAFCKTIFKPGRSTQRFCSLVCHGKDRLREEQARMADVRRICGCCSTPFTPKTERRIYCTPRCAAVMSGKARQQRKTPTPVVAVSSATPHILTCEWCNIEFASKMPNAKFCSNSHMKKAGRARLKDQRSNVVAFPQPLVLTVEIFDGWFERAA